MPSGQDFNTLVSNWKDQQRYMISDENYDILHRALRRGKQRYQYSFFKKCYHTCRRDCDCPKMVNVLRNGKIVRLVNGEERPVFKESEIMKGSDVHQSKMLRFKVPGENSTFRGCYTKRSPRPIQIYMNLVH